MSSEEFTPKNKGGRPKGSTNKPKDDQEPPKAVASTPKPDKYAIAAAKRKKYLENKANSGAHEGQKLVAPLRPGFVRRWVNDQKGKLDRMESRGYTCVEEGAADEPFEATSDNAGSKISQRVDFVDGEPLRAYLMEIPEEFHKQDQQEKEASILETVDAVKKGGAIGSQAYVPKGSSQYELE